MLELKNWGISPVFLRFEMCRKKSVDTLNEMCYHSPRNNFVIFRNKIETYRHKKEITRQ